MSRQSQGAVFDTVLAAWPHHLDPLDQIGWSVRQPDPDLGIDPDSLSREALAGLMTDDRWGPWTEALERVGNCAHPIRLQGA